MAKFGSNRQVSRRITRETSGGGTANRFAKTGKAKPAQFAEKTPGQREPGFKQKTPKQVTAAMMGGPMPSGHGKADAGPRRDAKRQFGNAPGRKVF